MSDHDSLWLIIEAERAFYVDRGREVILCDRLPSPSTLVLRISPEQFDKLRRDMSLTARNQS